METYYRFKGISSLNRTQLHTNFNEHMSQGKAICETTAKPTIEQNKSVNLSFNRSNKSFTTHPGR